MINQLLTTQAVVTTGATLILSQNQDAQGRYIRNGAAPTFIGKAGVTTTTGYLLPASVEFAMFAGSDVSRGVYCGDVWAIVTTGSQTVYTAEIR